MKELCPDQGSSTPVPPDFRALCAELLRELDHASHRDYQQELKDRARTALAEPEPPRPTDYELWHTGDKDFRENTWPTDAVRFARAVLARWGHQPAPSAAGEVGEVVAWLREQADNERGCEFDECEGAVFDAADKLTRAADLLSQRHPAPVPVSERLPGPEDCLDEGWAWFFNPRTGWRQASQPVHSAYTHWLPAHALPIPGDNQP